LVVALIILTLSACGEGSNAGTDLIVGDIERDLRWGNRKAQFEVSNPTEDLKFLTVESEIQFDGAYLTPHRRTISHVILPPGQSETVAVMVYIPGNYGRANGRITLYDVVDTLDIILPSQKAFEDNFMINFHPPEAIQPHLEIEITMPPRVDQHPDFDNQLSRLMLVLLSEGRSLDEIAAMTAADTAYIQEVYASMSSKGYVKEVDGQTQLQLPIISVAEAEQAKQIAEAVSDSLVTTIRTNLPKYRRVLDRLVAEGSVPRDSNAFLDGGTILYHPYPLVSCLLLWWDLGQRFITRSAPLAIYDGTDVCNAYIPNYMYSVQGGSFFNGTCFYALFQGQHQFSILFGDSLPDMECSYDFILKGQQGKQPGWTYDKGFRQETFVVDTTVLRPALNALAGDIDSLMVRTYFELKALSQSFGRDKASYGVRYWFWNLMASRTLVKLVQEGVLERRGNGQFKFEPYRGRRLKK
jgi:hypothetical protein